MMARTNKNRIRPPKPQLTPSVKLPLKEVDYPESRAMSSGVVAAVAKADIRKTLLDSIADGLIPVGINTDQIDAQSVESDRQAGWEEEEDFDLLLQNIRDRGQIQPVVVRPASENWQPSENTPMTVRETDRFILLSGRRRYLACVKLSKPVRAIIRVNPNELDIEERFFENTVRRGLTQLELHVSIGQIADARDWSQSKIAKTLGVPQPRVSKALKIFRNLPALLQTYPEANSFSREDLYNAVDHVEGHALGYAVGHALGYDAVGQETHEDVSPIKENIGALPSTEIVTHNKTPPSNTALQKLKVERPNLKGQFVRKNGKAQLRISLSLPDDATEDDVAALADKIASFID